MNDPYLFYVQYIAPILEIGILTVLIYYILMAIDRISAGGKLKGMAIALFIVVIAAWGANKAQLHAITWLLGAAISFSAVIMAVVFQPELRRLFVRMGALLATNEHGGNEALLDLIVESAGLLSAERIGALVVFEKNDHLDNYIATGPFECSISVRSFQTIFWKNSPVHDGAVIIRGGKIVAAGVILPLTQNFEYRMLSGTRHRAGIGITEDTDALALLVSEETGAISVADKGKLYENLSLEELAIFLKRSFGARGQRLTQTTT